MYDQVISRLSNKEVAEKYEINNGVPIATPVFDGASTKDITEMLGLAIANSGQTHLWNGQTGERLIGLLPLVLSIC